MRLNRPLLPIAAILISAPAIAESSPAPTRLDLSAEASVARAPDIALISAGVISDAPTAAQAIAENARRMSAARAALKAAGIADRDLQTTSLALSPLYRYAEGKAPEVTGYQASTMLYLRFRDIERAGKVIDVLVARGINQIQGPTFTFDDPAPLLDEARVKALAAARARAELYARAAGLKVRRIVSISEAGSFAPPPQPAPMLRAAAADRMAETGLAPGEQKLTASVAVSFELD
jgi:uncharacterized protein YggE